MGTGLVSVSSQDDVQQLANFSDLSEAARVYLNYSEAANTTKAHQSDWRDFETWCESRYLASLRAAPETVCLYLTDRASSCKHSTLARRLASISRAHQATGHESPTRSALVRKLSEGIRNKKGAAPTKKAAATIEMLRRMIEQSRCSMGQAGKRNRALLLIGFAGAFRRSELVALDVADLEFTTEGVKITIRKSKTDQAGKGEQVGIKYGHGNTCPVKALRAWLDAGGITLGPVFRSVNRHDQVGSGRLTDQSLALIVKAAAEAAGFDPSHFSGHSLRSGFCTTCGAEEVPERIGMKQTRHRSLPQFRKYIQDGSLFKQNASSMVGL